MEKNRKKIYLRLLKLLYTSHSGHIGSCLSCLDILIYTLLEGVKRHDIFLLSKGHAAPSLYILLNYLGKISDKELNTFHKEGTKLPVHTPNFHFKNQIHFPTGSLGHGLSLCCGMAHSIKLKIKKSIKSNNSWPRIFCLMSDGECNEGQVWEAAQYAKAKKLSNLIVLIDNNRLQAFGKTKDVLGNSTTNKKWKSFGFDVYESDGHDLKKIKNTFNKIKINKSSNPKVIIFNTVKGHGVSFMENKMEWHYNPMTKEQYRKAKKDIKKLI